MISSHLLCSCGSKNLTFTTVRFAAGWEPDGTIVETTLKSDLTNENPETMVSQRKVRGKDPARRQGNLDGVCGEVEIRFWCFDCETWNNSLRLRQNNFEDDVAPVVISWDSQPKTKKAKN
jgi:hypothetical protein